MSGRLRDGVFSMILPETWSVSPGIDRFQPAQFVDPGRAEAGLLVLDRVAGNHRHGHRGGVPAARRKPAEMGLGGGFVGQMERLRVVFARELEHFLAGHLIRAELGLRADLQILEIDHRRRIAAPPLGASAKARYQCAWQRQAPIGRWHPRLIEAAMALNENRLDVAERLLKPHLKDDPFDVAAIRMLAELAARIGRWRDSENLLRRAVELAPDWTAARANLAMLLGRMGRPAEAMELLDEIFADEPDDVGHWNLKARRSPASAISRRRIKVYEEVLERAPQSAWLVDQLRPHAEDGGRLAEGIDAYRQAIAIQAALGEAWWSLANLKTVKFDEADIAAMGAALNRRTSATRIVSTSISRSARRCTTPAALTRPSTIIRRPTHCA